MNCQPIWTGRLNSALFLEGLGNFVTSEMVKSKYAKHKSLFDAM